MGMSSTVRGIEAINETALLLSRIRFSAGRPAYAEGKRVAVSVDPRWNEETETVRVSITCYGLTLQQVDWEGLRINIERREADHSVTWLAFLNMRGQAVRDGLPPAGEYSLSLPCRVKSQLVAQVLSSPRRQIRKRGTIQWNYETDETKPGILPGAEAALREAIIQEGRTEDTSLLWRVAETEEGEVQVSLEAQKEMAGQRLAISLIESISGRLLHSGELMLIPAATFDRCEGRLRLGRYTELTRPCDLVFEQLARVHT
jgi:hypothetical protein